MNDTGDDLTKTKLLSYTEGGGAYQMYWNTGSLGITREGAHYRVGS